MSPTIPAERLLGARRTLEEASTLPAEAFTSPAVFAAETERLFAGGWLCAGRVDQVPRPGDYFALDLVGDALMVVRDTKGAVRVLSRVCRHRGAELVEGAGNTRTFQCPYHAWKYGTDGQLIAAPYMEGATGFDPTTCRLPEIRSELWEGWIFVNLDGRAEPLAPRLAPLSSLLAHYCMSEMVAVETASFDSPFNWKVLVDNFMEAYHHIAIHRDTFEPVFPARHSHAPENEGPYSVLMMPARDGADLPLPSLPRVGTLAPHEEGRLVAAVVFPFHLFAPSAEVLTWYQILPEAVDRFTLRIYSCFPRETLADPAHAVAVEETQALTRRVHHQDIEACEAAWAGLRSRSFDSGRLCPLEKSIWQFNHWWIERLSGPAPGEAGPKG